MYVHNINAFQIIKCNNNGKDDVMLQFLALNGSLGTYTHKSMKRFSVGIHSCYIDEKVFNENEQSNQFLMKIIRIWLSQWNALLFSVHYVRKGWCQQFQCS